MLRRENTNRAKLSNRLSHIDYLHMYYLNIIIYIDGRFCASKFYNIASMQIQINALKKIISKSQSMWTGLITTEAEGQTDNSRF